MTRLRFIAVFSTLISAGLAHGAATPPPPATGIQCFRTDASPNDLEIVAFGVTGLNDQLGMVHGSRQTPTQVFADHLDVDGPLENPGLVRYRDITGTSAENARSRAALKLSPAETSRGLLEKDGSYSETDRKSGATRSFPIHCFVIDAN